MTKDLKSQTIQGLFWSGFERIGQQGMQFIVSIILARLLLPEQFGLIGMLMIFMLLAQTFLDGGFGQALIQKQDATHLDECSIFYFNIFISFIAAGLLCITAPWIASFYNTPILTPLTRFISLSLIINAFGLVHSVLLSKQVDFKSQFKISLIATLLSGSIGITLACLGYGVWALAIQWVGTSLFRTVLLWLFSRWRPRRQFSVTSLRGMFPFGSRLLLSGLLNTFFENIYLAVIGKVFSPAALGFYSRAKQIQQLPTSNLSSTISRVTFPIFSKVQHNKTQLKLGLQKALLVLVTVNFPMMIGLAVVARPLVLLLLTEKWAPCIPYLQILCLAGMFFPLHVINLNALTAQGYSGLFLRLELLKKALILINIVIAYRWGIAAMIWGQVVVSLLSYCMNSYYSGKLLGYGLKQQVIDFAPYLGATFVMATCMYAVDYLGFQHHWSLLSAQILSGCVIYLALCRGFRLSGFMEVWQTGRRYIPGRQAELPSY